jgi:hypothetical protein
MAEIPWTLWSWSRARIKERMGSRPLSLPTGDTHFSTARSGITRDRLKIPWGPCKRRRRRRRRGRGDGLKERVWSVPWRPVARGCSQSRMTT